MQYLCFSCKAGYRASGGAEEATCTDSKTLTANPPECIGTELFSLWIMFLTYNKDNDSNGTWTSIIYADDQAT